MAINGITITPPQDQNEYTISSSALALLRTLNGDRPEVNPAADPIIPSANRLLLHCGQIVLQGCPIGIDWSVRHTPGQVHLSDVKRWDTCNEEHAVVFDEGVTNVPAPQIPRFFHIFRVSGFLTNVEFSDIIIAKRRWVPTYPEYPE